jgi:hypothetical protein
MPVSELDTSPATVAVTAVQLEPSGGLALVDGSISTSAVVWVQTLFEGEGPRWARGCCADLVATGASGVAGAAGSRDHLVAGRVVRGRALAACVR